MRLPNPMTAADRLRAALTGENRERAVFLSLAAYVLLWAVYGTVAKSSQGLHFDMVEAIAWSRDLSFGYLKHPPLAAAVVWAWFALFPVTEFAYYVLAMTMPALALWFAWRLSADYLDIEKRVAGLALLTLVPFFHFHALKFNVNTVLMPLWAATTFWFLRSFATRSRTYAVLAGLGAALCMMGKYWSVFLLAGLIVAALTDRRRALYFGSPAPWITVVVGLAVLSPHLYWLVQNDFASFGYAMGIHGDKTFAGTVVAAFGYLAGSLGYVALPVILVLAAARPDRATLADMIWSDAPERRLAAAAFWAPLLLPVLAAVASGTKINSLWSMSAWTLLPVLLLSPLKMTIRPLDTRRILVLAAALPLVMLLASPVIAILTRPDGPPPVNAQARLLADEVGRVWHASTPERLAFVGGDGDIVLGVVAFASGRPRAVLPEMPRPSAIELTRRGMVLLCMTGDEACLGKAAGTAGAAARTTLIEISQTVWGRTMPARRYTAIVVPPRL